MLQDVFNELSLAYCDEMDVNKVGYSFKEETLGNYISINHLFTQGFNIKSFAKFAVFETVLIAQITVQSSSL